MSFSIDLLGHIDFPALLRGLGPWIIAVSAAAGLETPAIVGFTLVFLSVLSMPECALSALIPALAADCLAFHAGRCFPSAGLFREPLLPASKARPPETGAGSFLYRIFPGNKLVFPFVSGQAGTFSSFQFAVLSFVSATLWLTYTVAAGWATSQLILCLAGSLAAAWLRLAGFILLAFIMIPVFRYILWHEIDRYFFRDKK